VRGFVPPPDQPLSPPFTRQYYAGRSGFTFVRADVTYLQQDFSVPLPVKNPGPWPAVQRFDFMVRERPATAADIQRRTAKGGEPRPPSEHQKSLFFALRELTGKNPGPAAEDWKRLFLRGVQVTPRYTGLSSVSGIAADVLHGRLFVGDAGALLRSDADDRWTPLLGDGPYRSLAVGPTGELLACDATRVVSIDPLTREVRVLADRYQGKPLKGPQQLCVNPRGGLYFTDAPAPTLEGPPEKGAVYFLSGLGTLTRLAIPLSRPGAVAVAPDGKTLYLMAGGSPQIMAYPLEGAGLPGTCKVLCRLDSRPTAPVLGGMGLAVDRQGNLFATNAALQAVQVFNSQGARLGQAPLPEAPVACTLGGEDGRTLFVATHTAIFAIRVETDGAVNIR
jgi:sugar lactone lactonase YvrE